MSALSNAFKAIREVLLLQTRIDTLDDKIGTIASDLDGITDLVGDLRDRVARLEGFIEGAAAATGQQARLPRN